MRGLFVSITALLAGTSFVHFGGGLIGTLIAMQMALHGFPVTTAGTAVTVVPFESGAELGAEKKMGHGHAGYDFSPQQFQS